MKQPKSFLAKAETVQHDWWVIDAEGLTLGRLATQVAMRLRGKDKPIFSPSVDTGDYVVVINAEKVKVTGNKTQDKHYHQYSGYPGGMRSTSFKDMIDRKPTFVLETAIKGMLPKNSLGRAMFKKLKVYAGAQHPHEAQQPQAWALQ
jgi:large subunit ribosomal protein L13